MTLLAGCTDPEARARLAALEARAEERVDVAIGDIVGRLCKLPIDIMLRQVQNDPDKAEGAYLLCPELRELVDLLRPISQRRSAPPG